MLELLHRTGGQFGEVRLEAVAFGLDRLNPGLEPGVPAPVALSVALELIPIRPEFVDRGLRPVQLLAEIADDLPCTGEFVALVERLRDRGRFA
ncbi:MAG: hypothetical protein ACLGHQ_07970 [Acidimicrobiia bacterium]